jgi:cytochrome bd-type quinol oxidase subunit 1
MTLDLARWQFALTSINHFFFVPVTIGLAYPHVMISTTDPALSLTIPAAPRAPTPSR